MSKVVALFDLDGSLADYEGALRRDLNLLVSPEEEALGLSNLWEKEKHPYIHNRMKLIKNQPGWWLNLERIEKGFVVVQMALDIGFDVQILTKGPGSHPTAWKEKLEWCQAQPELNGAPVHIVSDKSLVYGHLLYDDFPNYMDSWLATRPRGLGIMPLTLSNATYSHPQVLRWDYKCLEDRNELETILRRVYLRQPHEALSLV